MERRRCGTMTRIGKFRRRTVRGDYLYGGIRAEREGRQMLAFDGARMNGLALVER